MSASGGSTTRSFAQIVGEPANAARATTAHRRPENNERSSWATYRDDKYACRARPHLCRPVAGSFWGAAAPLAGSLGSPTRALEANQTD